MLAKQEFQEKLYKIIAALQAHGFEAELFYNISDFTKKLALVPCSGKTGEGIQELLLVLAGLSQRFLKEKLKLGDIARGVILELKREKGMSFVEAILYDGKLTNESEIAIATFDKPIVTKIRALQEVMPLSTKFKPSHEVRAATGVRMQLATSEGVLPGMPFIEFRGNLDAITEEFKKELAESIRTGQHGIIAKADSLGSLEALITLLKQEGISVCKAGIGPISKKDVIEAKANLEKEPLNAVILGFNVEPDQDAVDIARDIAILTDDVVYRLIEKLQKWRGEKQRQILRDKLLSLACICKLEILHNFVFRNSKPAIFGVRVLGGTLKPGTLLIAEDGEVIDKVKSMQSQGEGVQEAKTGTELAIALPNTNYERQLKDKRFLYSDLTENQFREFKKNKELLSSEEIGILQEIARIKRQEKPTWGI